MEKEKFLRKDIAENEKYIGNYNVNEAAQDASNVEEAPKISKAEEILGSMPKYEDFRKKTIKSCGCIIIKDNKVLLVSTKDGHGNLFWSFPKGNQEAGESDTETALRETKEEVGLTVDILDKNPIIVSHLTHNDTATEYIYLYLAIPQTETITLQKYGIESAEWIPFTEAEKKLESYYEQAWQEARQRIAKHSVLTPENEQ